jgi:hypothetical protein
VRYKQQSVYEQHKAWLPFCPPAHFAGLTPLMKLQPQPQPLLRLLSGTAACGGKTNQKSASKNGDDGAPGASRERQCVLASTSTGFVQNKPLLGPRLPPPVVSTKTMAKCASPLGP